MRGCTLSDFNTARFRRFYVEASETAFAHAAHVCGLTRCATMDAVKRLIVERPMVAAAFAMGGLGEHDA
jgi:uncharacterized protein (DUF169 family)